MENRGFRGVCPREPYKEGELEREVVCAKFAHTTIHGAVKGKSQVQKVIAYNQQLSSPPDPPRRRIGFGNDGDTLSKPYGKA